MKYKVMVIGSGAREHALCWKLMQSSLTNEVACCPGNAGMKADGIQCLPLNADTGLSGYLHAIRSFAPNEEASLTVVGPEVPLIEGVVDLLHSNGYRTFGPSEQAAFTTEGSKAACKALLTEAGVTTAKFSVAREGSFHKAMDYINEHPGPLVVKADGLAAGKGVFVCDNSSDARDAVWQCMGPPNRFGHAGKTVVLEERLTGFERSLIVITDGKYFVPLFPAMNFKRLGNGNLGPMTGGMGAFAPAPFDSSMLEESVLGKILDNVVEPTLYALRELRRLPFTGALYLGIMMTEKGPKVLEINARFGDPETQVLLPLMKNDLLEILLAATRPEGLKNFEIRWTDQKAVGVVVASPGYPDKTTGGKCIQGFREARYVGTHVFCGNIRQEPQGQLLTRGGRECTVVAAEDNFDTAVQVAYTGVSCITIEGGQRYRTDIGPASSLA